MDKKEIHIVAEVKASGEMIKDCKDLYDLDLSTYQIKVEKKTSTGLPYDLVISLNAQQNS